MSMSWLHPEPRAGSILQRRAQSGEGLSDRPGRNSDLWETLSALVGTGTGGPHWLLRSIGADSGGCEASGISPSSRNRSESHKTAESNTSTKACTAKASLMVVSEHNHREIP